MRYIYLLLIIFSQAISCVSPPKLAPIRQPSPSGIERRCSIPFLDGKWQFVHSIEAEIGKRERAVFIGITALSPKEGTIHCVIMTLEGLVLFDASYDQKIVINRGIFPFDSPNFAEGLVSDIKLIFFPPEGQLMESGLSGDGSLVCRYETKKGMMVDVTTHGDGTWEINQYNDTSELTRSVRTSPEGQGVTGKQGAIAGRLQLTAYGTPGYSLNLKLIEAKKLDKRTQGDLLMRARNCLE